MAPDSETTSEKVEKNLSDLTLPEICSLNQDDLNFSIKDNSHVDKGEKISDVPQNPNKKVDEGDGIPVPEVQLYPPGQVCLEWAEVHKIGAGLANLGNTCFLNTVIQCLTYCPPLANYLLQGDHSANCKNFEFCMMCELQKHTRQVFQRSGDVIKPLCIYQNLKYIADHFQFGQQEDAHEFLRFVIDNLWRCSIYNHLNEDKLDPASRETTIINHIFGGYNRSQVVCLQCNQKSDKYEHFMDLILDIQNAHSLEKAVEQFVKPELLENENAYKCPKCNTLVPAEKTFRIHRPPNVATFQLKRFHYYKSYGKITKHISYPENFDLRPYMSQTKGGSLLYKLNAVLVHMGQNCNSGHYYCYIRNSNGCWYLMDDAKVQKVNLHDVLNEQAYVLFYVRSPHSGIHFKKNVSPAFNLQKIKLRSPGNTVSQSSSPKKHQSFQSSFECTNKSSENGIDSSVYSPLHLSPNVCNVGSPRKSDTECSNYHYDNNDENVGTTNSHTLKLKERKPPYATEYSAHKRVLGKEKHRNASMHYKNLSLDERGLLSEPCDSSFHLSSAFEMKPQDTGYGRSSSAVCTYGVHYNMNSRVYANSVEGHQNLNAPPKYQNSEHCYSNCFDKSFVPHKVSRNQYRGGKSSFNATHSFNERYWRERFPNTPHNYRSLLHKSDRNEGYYRNSYINGSIQNNSLGYKRNICTNGYLPHEEFRDCLNGEQFSSVCHQNELTPRNFLCKPFPKTGERHEFNAISEANSGHFCKGSERNSDFRNSSTKNYGDSWIWRKEHSSFPNILEDNGSRVYQGKVKRNRHYFSCRMAHLASPSFMKFKGNHRPSPYHNKCFYLNIC